MSALYNKCNISGARLYSPWVLLPNEFVPTLQKTQGMVISLRSTNSPAITFALKMQICSSVIDLSYPRETLGECRILHPAELRCAGIHIHPPSNIGPLPQIIPHTCGITAFYPMLDNPPPPPHNNSQLLPSNQASSKLQVFCKVKC